MNANLTTIAALCNAIHTIQDQRLKLMYEAKHSDDCVYFCDDYNCGTTHQCDSPDHEPDTEPAG